MRSEFTMPRRMNHTKKLILFPEKKRYNKQDQQGKAVFNERNPHMTQHMTQHTICKI
jgi:hypothetical protein